MPSRSYRHFIRKLFLLDGKNKGQNNKYTEVTATASELNIMDGVTADASELNALDGATAVNSTAGKVAILATGGALSISGDLGTTSKIGAIPATGTITVSEGGHGARHTTKLTLTAFDIGAIAAGAAEAIGALIYTFPATGDILLHHAGVVIGITGQVAIQGDEPDVGLGSVIGTGAVATLDGTPTFEDIMTGQTWTATCDGTDQIAHVLPTAGVDFVYTKGATNKVHLNVADLWADASSDLLVTGSIWLDWSIRTY